MVGMIRHLMSIHFLLLGGVWGLLECGLLAARGQQWQRFAGVGDADRAQALREEIVGLRERLDNSPNTEATFETSVSSTSQSSVGAVSQILGITPSSDSEIGDRWKGYDDFCQWQVEAEEDPELASLLQQLTESGPDDDETSREAQAGVISFLLERGWGLYNQAIDEKLKLQEQGKWLAISDELGADAENRWISNYISELLDSQDVQDEIFTDAVFQVTSWMKRNPALAGEEGFGDPSWSEESFKRELGLPANATDQEYRDAVKAYGEQSVEEIVRPAAIAFGLVGGLLVLLAASVIGAIGDAFGNAGELTLGPGTLFGGS